MLKWVKLLSLWEAACSFCVHVQAECRLHPLCCLEKGQLSWLALSFKWTTISVQWKVMSALPAGISCWTNTWMVSWGFEHWFDSIECNRRVFVFLIFQPRWSPTASWRRCCPPGTFSCLMWELLMNTRRETFHRLSTSLVRDSTHVKCGNSRFLCFVLFFFNHHIVVFFSGHSGGVSEAVVWALSEEVQREGSWERRRQPGVSLQERQPERHSAGHCPTARIQKVSYSPVIAQALHNPVKVTGEHWEDGC